MNGLDIVLQRINQKCNEAKNKVDTYDQPACKRPSHFSKLEDDVEVKRFRIDKMGIKRLGLRTYAG